MNNQGLRAFYEQKYSHESENASIELIKPTNFPTSRFEAVMQYFPKHFKGGDILELASGSGNINTSLLNSELEIQSYTASDISLPRLTNLKRNLDDSRLRILEIDAEKIPEAEYGKYDAVIMIALIEHLIDPLKAMQQIRTLLKPGGFVYIDTPNMAKYTRRIKLLFGKFPSTASENEGLTTYFGQPVALYDEGHLHYFTYRSLTLMLTQRCGFASVIKLGYPMGKTLLGKHIDQALAKAWPELFSELAVIAYA